MNGIKILVEILAYIVYLFLGTVCIGNAVCYFKQQRWYLFGLETMLSILMIYCLINLLA